VCVVCVMLPTLRLQIIVASLVTNHNAFARWRCRQSSVRLGLCVPSFLKLESSTLVSYRVLLIDTGCDELTVNENDHRSQKFGVAEFNGGVRTWIRKCTKPFLCMCSENMAKCSLSVVMLSKFASK